MTKPTPPDSISDCDKLPRGSLPPHRKADLPEPVSLRRMLGPGVILAGLALGSGEFIHWPYIAFESKFVFFWACLLGVTTQYFLNMEITRWTLATGESAITGFARLSRSWAWVFLLLNILPFLIPAWAKGAAQIMSWIFFDTSLDADGVAQSPYVTELTIAGLVGCALVLTAGRVVYETVEKVQIILVGGIILLVIAISICVVRVDAVVAQAQGAINIGGIPEFTDQLTAAFLLGAIAFAGAGGTLNLGQSNYIKDKGYGMGKYIGRITSPITRQKEAVSEIGYFFPLTKLNIDRWKTWWRNANLEHFLTFYLTCVVCLVLLSLISYSLFYDAAGNPVSDREDYGQNILFILGEATHLESLIGPAMKIIFLIMGAAILLSTEFGLLDVISRISADTVKVNWLQKKEQWTQGRIYYLFLWGLVIVSIALLLIGVHKVSTFELFKYTAAMNGGVMFLYTGLLLYLNRFKLPHPIRMGWTRLLIMVWAVAFFGFFAVWAVWNTITGS